MKVFGSIALFFTILYNSQILHGPAATASSNVNESDLKINLNINANGLNEGNFAPGRQKIESRDFVRPAGTACKDVTLGECPILFDKGYDIKIPGSKIQECSHKCYQLQTCNRYRFNHQTKECTLLWGDYLQHCKIRAGPVEKQTMTCLMGIYGECDPQTEEECEYTGNDVKRYQPGEIIDDDVCQESCKALAPTCKYWIYNHIERVCILKEEATRICKVFGGPKNPTYNKCHEK